MAFLLSCLLTALFVLPLTVLVALYVHHVLVGSKYFAKRRIPHVKPVFLLGNLWRANIIENVAEIVKKIHIENRHNKLVGFWMFNQPAIMVMDTELAKRILIKDFNVFRDRGIEIDTEVDPLAGHLFMLNGRQWRNLRVKLTPTFTSGKMKMMFPTMVKVGHELRDYLRGPASRKETIEVKDLLARFTTDVISSCAFGLEANSLQNPNSEFRNFGKKVFTLDLRGVIVNMLFFTYPKLLSKLKIPFFRKEVTDFFVNVVRETIEHREKTGTTRNDFLQLIIQLMRAGKIENADKTPIDDMTDEELVYKFSLLEAAAQCFVFFGAGFETSSSALSFSLYELALNPTIQQRLQAEIDEVLGRHGGELTYEAMNEMEYLEMVVQETLRKYPPVANLQRKALKEYPIPEMNITLDEGTIVMFSVTGIHHDPDIYPEPDVFDPERFTPEAKAKRDTCAYLPFGEGPRNCIGNRFGLMQIRIGLISILREYNVEVCKLTPIPIKFDVRTFIPTAVGGMHLAFSTRART